MPNLVTYLNWTPLVEWHVVSCDPRTDAKHTCGLEEIGLHSQHIISILGSIINIIGGNLCDHLMRS